MNTSNLPNGSSNNTLQPPIPALVVQSLANLKSNYLVSAIFAGIGIPCGVFSGVVLLVLYRERHMRSRYYANMAHLVAADMIYELITGILGLKRIAVLFSDGDEVASPLRCSIDTAVPKFGQLASGGQTLAMAIDRGLAVAVPVWYFVTREANRQYVNAVFWAISCILPAVMTAGLAPIDQVANCVYSLVYQGWAKDMMNNIQLGYFIAIIVIYVFMPVAARIRAIQNGAKMQALAAAEQEKMRRVNKMSLSVALTYTATWGAGMIYQEVYPRLAPPELRPILGPFGALFAISCPYINLLLYYALDSDFRAGLAKLFCGSANHQVAPSVDATKSFASGNGTDRFSTNVENVRMSTSMAAHSRTLISGPA